MPRIRGAAVLLGPLLGAQLVAAAAPVVGLPSWLIVVAVVPGLLAAFTVANGTGPATAAILTAGAATIPLFLAGPLTVLSARGQESMATVVQERYTTEAGRGGPHDVWHDTLVLDGGTLVPGELVQRDQHVRGVGDRFLITYDPHGLTAPRDTADLADVGVYWVAFGVCEAAAVGLAVVAAHLDTRPPRSRPGRAANRAANRAAPAALAADGAAGAARAVNGADGVLQAVDGADRVVPAGDGAPRSWRSGADRGSTPARRRVALALMAAGPVLIVAGVVTMILTARHQPPPPPAGAERALTADVVLFDLGRAAVPVGLSLGVLGWAGKDGRRTAGLHRVRRGQHPTPEDGPVR